MNLFAKVLSYYCNKSRIIMIIEILVEEHLYLSEKKIQLPSNVSEVQITKFKSIWNIQI